MVERKWDLDREETDDGCCNVIILHVFLERKWVNYVFKKKCDIKTGMDLLPWTQENLLS